MKYLHNKQSEETDLKQTNKNLFYRKQIVGKLFCAEIKNCSNKPPSESFIYVLDLAFMMGSERVPQNCQLKH